MASLTCLVVTILVGLMGTQLGLLVPAPYGLSIYQASSRSLSSKEHQEREKPKYTSTFQAAAVSHLLLPH